MSSSVDPADPHPPRASTSKAISLFERQTLLALLPAGSLLVVVVWFLEQRAGVIEPLDGFAYPALITTWTALFVVLWRLPERLLLVQWLATVPLLAFFVAGTLLRWLDWGANPGIYWLASLLPWLMTIHLVVFVAWPMRPAILLSLALIAVSCLPAFWIQWLGLGDAQWEHLIWPTVLNGFLAQVVTVPILFGIGRLKQRVADVTSTNDTLEASLSLKQWSAQRTRELELAREAAEAASQAKTRFLAVISHELRTPLNGVLGAAQLLRDDRHTPAQREQLFETLASSGAILARLIDQVLDMSRIEAGDMNIVARDFDLVACISDALAAVSVPAQRKGMALRRDIAAGLASRRHGDALRLAQVLVNLLGNAVKFTDRGWVALTVSEPAPGRLRFIVEDSGPGIPEADRARVLQAFQQLDDASTRAHPGSGLGLTITHELVRLMGGTLALTGGAAGRGTRVCVELPLPAATVAAPPPSSAGEVDLVGVRALVVDDDAVNSLLATEMLRGAGAEVEAAASGQEALAWLARRPFDIVLMDWRMPGMDGLEATQRVRGGEAGAEAARLPVLGVTASAFDADRQTCLDAGMDEVLTKPIDRSQLLATVQRLCLAR